MASSRSGIRNRQVSLTGPGKKSWPESEIMDLHLNKQRSSFSFKSSVRNLSLIRSSRLCYSSHSAFTDSPVDTHTTIQSQSQSHSHSHSNNNNNHININMNISAPISVTLGRDLQSIPRQPLPPPTQSTSTNPVTLVRTPSEAVRKILSNQSSPRRHLRSPAPPLPSSNARPSFPFSTRNSTSAPDLATSRHFASDPKLYPVSSTTSPLLSPPLIINNNHHHSHSRSPISPHRLHPPFNPIQNDKTDLNRSRHPLIPTPLSPAPSHSPSPDIASYQAWAATNSPTCSPPASQLPPGTAITTLESRPDTISSTSPQSSPDRQASKSSQNLSPTSPSLINRPRLKPLYTPHIDLGKAPAAVMRRKPLQPPGALSPPAPSLSPHSPTLVIPNTHHTHPHFTAKLLAPLSPNAPPPTILSLNVGGKVFMTAIENVMSRPSFLADFIARQLVTWSRLSLEAVGTGDGLTLMRSWKTGNELGSTHPHDLTTTTTIAPQGREENWTGQRNTPKAFSSPISEPRYYSETDDEALIKPLTTIAPLKQHSIESSWAASTKVETHHPEGILEIFLDRDPGPYNTLFKFWRFSSSLLSFTSSCSSASASVSASLSASSLSLLLSSNAWTCEVEEEAKWLGIQKDVASTTT